MTRFFADKSEISDKDITLNAQDTAHIRSLRLRPDELFIVCDGEETDYVCKLLGTADIKSLAKEKCAIAEIVEKRRSKGEPTIKCSAFIAYAKGDRLDYAVQKSVELGVYEINLFPSERCVSVPNDTEKKIARFQKISLETAKQCNRGIVPVVNAAKSFKEAVALAIKADMPLLPYECEDRLGLKKALEQGLKGKASYEKSQAKVVSIMTGPEGGFSEKEAEYAVENGMLAVTLGSRILRCETAPAAVLAAIMYHTENLG